MKNTITLAIFAAISTLTLVGCGQTANSPADTVITPDAATLQKQQDFDQAMIQKQNTITQKGQ